MVVVLVVVVRSIEKVLVSHEHFFSDYSYSIVTCPHKSFIIILVVLWLEQIPPPPYHMMGGEEGRLLTEYSR